MVLLSGGLDSAVALFAAVKKGYECQCLTFDYGQRHKVEIACAKKIASEAGAKLRVVNLRLPWKGSSLLDKGLPLPLDRSPLEIKKKGIPPTYVPARNTIFLSFAASFAEAIGANAIFIGAHSEDSSGYPDCREEYLEAFGKVIELGTKRGLEKKLKLEFPLINMAKKEIIELGQTLGVPFQFTRSCYEGLRKPCGRCDSCVLRSKGFREAGVTDPAAGYPPSHSSVMA